MEIRLEHFTRLPKAGEQVKGSKRRVAYFFFSYELKFFIGDLVLVFSFAFFLALGLPQIDKSYLFSTLRRAFKCV